MAKKPKVPQPSAAITKFPADTVKPKGLKPTPKPLLPHEEWANKVKGKNRMRTK